MNSNSRPTSHGNSPNFAFALGLLIGVAMMLVATQQGASSRRQRADRRARNEAILGEVLNEVIQ